MTTWAEPRQAVWLRENATGRTAAIGRFDPALPGPENRMRPCAEGFAALGVPALARCAAAAGEWATVDEVGYLDAACPEYAAALTALLDQKRVMAVVRKQPLPLLQALCTRPDAFVVDLDAPFGRAGCVIMASGEGKRFGGNKLLADFSGQPMLCRALAATDGLFARRIVVTRHPQVTDLCRERGVPVLLHDQPLRSDTVRLGLQALLAAEPALSGCLFCPGDQPLLRQQTVAALALCAAADPQSIWRPAHGDTPGAPALFPRWSFDELQTLPAGKGGGAVVKAHPQAVRTVPVADGWELADADTPQTLEQLAARYELHRP